MKPKVSEWLTEDAVKDATSELMTRMVGNLMKNRNMTQEEALNALGISYEEYENRGNC